jgi:putative ATPase
MTETGRTRSIFDAAAVAEQAARAPLAARLRPKSLEDVVGQRHLLGPGGVLLRLAGSRRLPSLVLFGPPGTGKTTLALLLAEAVGARLEPLSATSATVADVRRVLGEARERLGLSGQATIVFIDEIHRFSRAQQDVLLPAVEEGIATLVGATTENPFFHLNRALQSRTLLVRLEPLDASASAELLDRAEAALGARFSGEARALLVSQAAGDGRRLLGLAEAAVLARQSQAGAPGGDASLVSADDVRAVQTASGIPNSDDDHYDIASALIKSIRGSDVDAGLYWLARALAAGEDPRFVARRLVILASEDVGEADPSALLVALAAAQALEMVGLPEAKLNLAQAVVHLARAPKSNATAKGIWGAEDEVRASGALAVPISLRDAHSPGMRSLGNGTGYRYPHDEPTGWVEQEYLPSGLVGRRFWFPSSRDMPPSSMPFGKAEPEEENEP